MENGSNKYKYRNSNVSLQEKDEINDIVFTANDLKILEKNGQKEPDWVFMFFDWMHENLKDIYFSNLYKIYNSSNLNFIRGLMYEYGYNGFSIDYDKAFECYINGIESNNHYCYYKLFFIFKDHYEIFKKEQDFDLAMFFLIKASSYNESFLDLNRIDPIMKMKDIIYYKDRDLNKCSKLIRKIKDNPVRAVDPILLIGKPIN